MRLINFTAKCQNLSIADQFREGVRAFDLRVRFEEKSLVIVHNLFEYEGYLFHILNCFGRLNKCVEKTGESVMVRIIHDCRTKRQYDSSSSECFRDFCEQIEKSYPNISFFGGNCFYTGKTEYAFRNSFSQESAYASGQPPLIDDLWPWLYAKNHNEESRRTGTEKNILWLDFINI